MQFCNVLSPYTRVPVFWVYIFVLSFNSYAQTDTAFKTIKDTVILNQGTLKGITLTYQNKEIYRFKDMKLVLGFNDENKKLMASAETGRIFSSILGAAGGFCIGYALGFSLSGRPVNMPLLGAGAGLLVLSIPITMTSNRKLRQAVRNFNSR